MRFVVKRRRGAAAGTALTAALLLSGTPAYDTFTVQTADQASYRIAESGLCKGDAGAPMFGGATPVLYGLVSTSYQAGCLTEAETRSGATAVRVQDLGAWIDQKVAVQCQPGTLRRPVSPDALHRLVEAHRSARLHQQRGHDRALPGRAQLDGPAVRVRLQRSQNLKPHRRRPLPALIVRRLRGSIEPPGDRLVGGVRRVCINPQRARPAAGRRDDHLTALVRAVR
ncbi:hypothetical protein [Phytohabitans houttuyneae]|uniref:Peptidase S1 domain-containing protein n=1 Tax=Phytohabitans houttuyneae TaxID=1076126 RepID=A0A6V8KGH9_9ACTN|nr:hypothetical protein [Phytohabitans houttuyneae]GFJ81199.1 hypothetical protein Phou_053790 [Phytohabitans houttuyneae]